MIECSCDMCGKRIDIRKECVSITFRTENIELFNSVNEDKQLCKSCCDKVKGYISSSLDFENYKKGK